MFTGLMQDWVTNDGNGTTPFVQSRSAWMDLAAYGDLTFWLDVRSVSPPGAGSVTLTYETSPTLDESAFTALASITLTTAPNPSLTHVALASNPGLGRYVRWKLAGTAAGNWSATFRIFASAGVGAGGAFDPSALSLTGWWRASYSGAPWVGSASNGTSGAKSLATVLNNPTVGTAVNGFTPADCSGKTKQLADTTDAMNTFVSATAYTFVILFYANSAGAPAGGTVPYNEDAFISDTTGGAYFGSGFSTNGIQVYHFDGSYTGVIVAASTGAWHLAIARYDGTNLKVRLDSGADSSLAKGTISAAVGGSTNFLRFEDRYVGDQAHGVDALVMEVMFAQTALSDGDCANIKSYVNARYGLSL